jgi:hypothetical protein
MCVFCAAIPATLAIGANAKIQQNKQIKLEEAQKLSKQSNIPVGLTTGLVVGGLVISSIIYHTQQG